LAQTAYAAFIASPPAKVSSFATTLLQRNLRGQLHPRHAPSVSQPTSKPGRPQKTLESIGDPARKAREERARM